jgi:hypothetical protein
VHRSRSVFRQLAMVTIASDAVYDGETFSA